MKASLLIKHNVDTLLRVRAQSRKDLAQYCYKSESWISKIFKEPRREFSLRDVDRIADFFGIATYQLFQPGISTLTERRQMERRGGRDRRIGHAMRGMQVAAVDIAVHRSSKKDAHVAVAPPPSPAAAELKHIIADFERLASRLLTRAESGGQAPGARLALPGARPPRRADRGSNLPKP